MNPEKCTMLSKLVSVKKCRHGIFYINLSYEWLYETDSEMEFTEDSSSDYIPPGYCYDRSHVRDSTSDNNTSIHCSEDHEAVPKKRSRNVHLWKKKY